jgi:hypothetical protein
VVLGLNCLYCSQGLDGVDMVVGDPLEGILVMIGITWCCGPMTSPESHGNGLSRVVGFDSTALRYAMICCITTSLMLLGKGSFISKEGEF